MTGGGELAALLAAALATAGINQAELARRSGLTRAYVGRLLAGAQAAPTPGVLAALADGLGLAAAERLRLFAAAGLLPAELTTALGRSPTLARLLVTLQQLPPARRAALERALAAVLDLLEAPQ